MLIPLLYMAMGQFGTESQRMKPLNNELQVTSIPIFPDSKTFKHLGFSLPPGKTYTIMGVGLGQDAW